MIKCRVSLALAFSFFVLAAPCSAKDARTVKTGLDVFEEHNFAALRGKRVGVITNQTGVDRGGRSLIGLLANAPGVTLAAVFSPEHGLFGRVDETVASSTLEVKTRQGTLQVPVYSLYGDTRRPTPQMLAGLDAIVFDIQDAGVRFYTYITTMGYAMEEAARRHIVFYVLDRPNPLGGEVIEGPMLDRDRTNFTGYFPLPVRYAMTIGELARMFNAEIKIRCDLRVIAMQGWQRRFFYADTKLQWIPPSPNLRSLDGAVLYPGLEILQAAGVSVGRGTPAPFEEFGVPWMRGEELADELNRRDIPGVRFRPAQFTPESGLHKGVRCEGAAIEVTDRNAVRSMRMGLEIAATLQKLYGSEFLVAKILPLLGNTATIEKLERGVPPADIISGWAADLTAFRKIRAKYLRYH